MDGWMEVCPGINTGQEKHSMSCTQVLKVAIVYQKSAKNVNVNKDPTQYPFLQKKQKTKHEIEK